MTKLDYQKIKFGSGPFFGWSVVLGCLIGELASSGPLIQGSLGVIMSSLTDEFHWNRGEISFIVTIYTAVTAALIPIIGRLMDGIGVKKILLPTIACSALLFMLPALMTKLWQFYLLIFSVTSIIFLPTAIANPQAVKNIISGETTRRIIAENHNIFYFIDISKAYLSDPFLTSFNLFVISIFIIFLITTAKKIKREINNELLVLIIYFFSFFIFTIMFSRIYSFRYLVPILIIFQIIAGMGIYEFSNMFIKKYNITNKKIIYYWIIIFILVSQGLLIYYSKIEKIQELPYFG